MTARDVPEQKLQPFREVPEVEFLEGKPGSILPCQEPQVHCALRQQQAFAVEPPKMQQAKP